MPPDMLLPRGSLTCTATATAPKTTAPRSVTGLPAPWKLEIGVEDIPGFYAEREGKSVLNYGASISHPYSRNLVMTGSNPGLEGEALTQPLSAEQQEALQQHIAAALDAGAVGVGFGVGLVQPGRDARRSALHL